jgi:ATPase subunit of ABC transporter with duplicated ATPase domains
MGLNAVDLACRRGGREVFASVSFRLARGEALAVTGRNGAGKSSLLRIVGGFIRPGGGRLWLENGDAELTIAEQAHYLGHQDAVKPSLDKLSLIIARESDGKMRVTSASWDGEKVILRDQVLEVRNVEGRIHVARKPRHHDEWDRYVEPYDPYGPGASVSADAFTDD